MVPSTLAVTSRLEPSRPKAFTFSCPACAVDRRLVRDVKPRAAGTGVKLPQMMSPRSMVCPPVKLVKPTAVWPMEPSLQLALARNAPVLAGMPKIVPLPLISTGALRFTAVSTQLSPGVPKIGPATMGAWANAICAMLQSAKIALSRQHLARAENANLATLGTKHLFLFCYWFGLCLDTLLILFEGFFCWDCSKALKFYAFMVRSDHIKEQFLT